MSTIEKRIEVECPRTVVYDQWTQFELFPQFMDGVTNVTQVGNKRLHWKAQIGGKEKEWDAEIFEQLPDERIAWRSMGGQRAKFRYGEFHLSLSNLYANLSSTELRSRGCVGKDWERSRCRILSRGPRP